jgi:hypothetical protein
MIQWTSSVQTEMQIDSFDTRKKKMKKRRKMQILQGKSEA